MSYSVAIQFEFIKEGDDIEVLEPEYLSLPTPIEIGHVSDNCESYVIRNNIETIVEHMEDGHYDCLLAGTWDWESMGVDFESQVEDFEVLIEHKFLSIQKHIETEN